MIRMLLTTTALAAMMTAGALAQQSPAPAETPAQTETSPAETPAQPPAETPAQPETAPAQPETAPAQAPTEPMTTPTDADRSPIVLTEGYSELDGDQLATRILGAMVYTSAADDAETIGDINDLVVDANGDIVAVVIGVGGFLGMGEKNVAVDFAQLEWSTATDGTNRYVLATTAEELTAAPDFVYQEEGQPAAPTEPQTPPVTPAPTTEAPAPTTEAPATTPAPAAEPAPSAEAPAVVPLDRSTLQEFDEAAVTAEELTGTRVFGVNDEEVGVIGDFVLGDSGSIDAVIIDVGGFLGIGQKPVAVGFDDLNFSVDANNNRYLFINTTREQLEAQPEFNRDTYAVERDTQRLVVQP